MTTPSLTLITGAHGKTGRRVADRLEARGHAVRRVSRSTSPRFEWEDAATWAAALDGVDAVYVTYQPDLAVPGADATVSAFAAQAAAAGVERLVLLSGRGEVGAQRAEDAVRAAFPAATVVRSAWFAQNFSEGHLLEPVLAGTIVLPAGNVAEPFVDADDLADIAVAALLDPARHAGELYEVTGPRLLTFAQAAAELTAATGRPVRYRPVAGDEYEAMLVDFGVPAHEAAMLTALFAETLAGHNAHTTDGVQRALGRPPRDFADYARAAAATGVWNVEVPAP